MLKCLVVTFISYIFVLQNRFNFIIKRVNQEFNNNNIGVVLSYSFYFW